MTEAAPPVAEPTLRVRATNKDREQVAALVRSAVADGSLTADEGEHRTQSIRAAVHRDELDAFLVDLPVAQSRLARQRTRATRSGSARTFVAEHRLLSIVIAVVLVLLVCGVAAAGFEAFGGGHGGGHGGHGARFERTHDGR